MNPQQKRERGRIAAAGVVLAIAAVTATAQPHAADASHGKALFDKTCASCHSTDAGVNKVGPTLFDVVDRPVASVQDYGYSPTMKGARKTWKTWNGRNLNAYLSNPRQVLKGVKMFYAVPDEQDRADVIAYLKELK